MWNLDYKECWGPKNWCFWTVVLSWNSNTLATWCEELTNWKRHWCWERLKAGGEGTTEDEMAGCHHRVNGHEFGWTLGVGDGQGGLECCNSWGHKESDMTERLNRSETSWHRYMSTDPPCEGKLPSCTVKRTAEYIYSLQADRPTEKEGRDLSYNLKVFHPISGVRWFLWGGVEERHKCYPNECSSS